MKTKAPMTDRPALLHYARVLVAQSRHFRTRHRAWSFTLLTWAGNARRRATETPAQIPLF